MRQRGAYPEFKKEDVILALIKLKTPIGRKKLADFLNIGEGSVRTLLERLDKLLDSSTKGHYLNKNGEEALKSIKDHMEGPKKLNSNINSEEGTKYSLFVKTNSLKSGTKIRDELIRGGAKGGLVLNVNKNNILFPEDETPLKEIYPKLDNEIRKKYNSSKGVILVAWNEKNTRKAVIRAALSLNKDFNRKIEKII